MSISWNEVDAMATDADDWWSTRGVAEKMECTGARDDMEANRRFYALNVADRWHLSKGHIETVAGYNWVQKGE